MTSVMGWGFDEQTPFNELNPETPSICARIAFWAVLGICLLLVTNGPTFALGDHTQDPNFNKN